MWLVPVDYDEGLDFDEPTELFLLRRIENRVIAIRKEQRIQGLWLAVVTGLVFALGIKILW